MNQDETLSISDQLFGESYHEAYDYVSDYTACHIVQCLLNHGVGFAKPTTELEVINKLRCIPSFLPSLRWALAYLTQQKFLLRINQALVRGPKFNWYSSPPANPITITPSLALIDHIARHWISIVKGEERAFTVLFGGDNDVLWQRYFSNEHGLYAVHNLWAAEAFVHRYKKTKSLSILEVGAGYGSGTSAFLSKCAASEIRPEPYVVSDVSVLLANKTKRFAQHQFPQFHIKGEKVDLNNIQEDHLETYDCIVSVNALHCAKEPVVAAANLRSHLKEDGMLLISECTRADVQTRLHQEYIFSLLPGFGNVHNDNAPLFGFYSADKWQDIMKAAGFRDTNVIINSGEKKRGLLIQAKR